MKNQLNKLYSIVNKVLDNGGKLLIGDDGNYSELSFDSDNNIVVYRNNDATIISEPVSNLVIQDDYVKFSTEDSDYKFYHMRATELPR